MAATIRGVQPLSFGVETITGYVVASTTRDASTEEFIIKDEVGDVITQITGFGEKTEYNLDVIPKAAVGTPGPGDILGVGDDLMVIITIQKKRMTGDAEKWTVKGVSYPGIDLTDDSG